MTQNTNPYASIQSQYAGFSRVSRKIADFILKDPTHCSSISVQQMAAELNIAESSIIRFSKSIGCAGFTDMKLMLAKFSPLSVRTIFEDLDQNDPVEAITRNVFSRNIDTLQRAQELLDFDRLQEAVELMSRASCITVLGIGASGTIADDFYIRLMRVGMRAVSLTDSHLMQIAARQAGPEDVYLAITHTGKTQEILRALKHVRDHGGHTISITGYPNTPVKELSDFCLELYSPEQLFVSPRVAQFSLLDSLYVCLTIRKEKEVTENIQGMNAVLEPFRINDLQELV
ncbi:MAG: MurR/RpiR family transcriptional regulator [Eubacterium sp.]|nr:MurR/RpiR family transcriptional regulator [Eubacterium sp.]MBR2188394.1 MurR/RpiR family transcriptional regulator [Eubacterium sp.]